MAVVCYFYLVLKRLVSSCSVQTSTFVPGHVTLAFAAGVGPGFHPVGTFLVNILQVFNHPVIVAESLCCLFTVGMRAKWSCLSAMISIAVAL